MIEVRKLTREEFEDLIRNSADGKDIMEYDNPFELFSKSPKSCGIVIDKIPVYTGCVVGSPMGKTTESMLRKGCREKYAFTLYKVVKKKVQEWANIFGTLRCYMNLDGSEDSKLVYRWIKKMGYVEEGFIDGKKVMVLHSNIGGNHG